MEDTDEAQQTALPGPRPTGSSVAARPPHVSRRPLTRRASRSRTFVRQAANSSDGSLASLLDVLQVFDLFAANSDGIQKIDSPPDNEALKRDKRTFILRRKTAHRKAEGAAKYTAEPASGPASDRFDYEKKYPADEPEKAYEPDARVWRVYLDEAGQFDLDMIENIRDTVDVILVFAGLFSAIVSTLVSSASTALQLDYVQVTAALLIELIAVQRAAITGGSLAVAGVMSSPLNLGSPPSSTGSVPDRWINGLWFTSLAFSLVTALIAALIKQWIQAYVAPTFQGSPKDHGRIRHFRYLGMEEWHVPLIVGLLPTLLHLSLFLFLIGLVVFLFTLDYAIGSIVACITSAALFTYVFTNIMPLRKPQCPYKTPISNYAPKLKPILLAFIPSMLRRTSWSAWTQGPRTLKESEAKSVEQQGEDLSFRMLGWLCQTSANPSVLSVVHKAVGDLPIKFSGRAVLRENLLHHVCAGVQQICPPSSLDASPLPTAANNTLLALLKAHLSLTPIQDSADIASNEDPCYCCTHSDVMAHKLIQPEGYHPLLFVDIDSPHRFSDQRPPNPPPQWLLDYQPPHHSRRVWISVLQRIVLESTRCNPSDTINYVPPGPGTWAGLTPFIRLLCQGYIEDDFYIRQGVLLAAYLAWYTYPQAHPFGTYSPSFNDHHEMLDVVLYPSSKDTPLMEEGMYHEVLIHYIRILCRHALYLHTEEFPKHYLTEEQYSANPVMVSVLEKMVPMMDLLTAWKFNYSHADREFREILDIGQVVREQRSTLQHLLNPNLVRSIGAGYTSGIYSALEMYAVLLELAHFYLTFVQDNLEASPDSSAGSAGIINNLYSPYEFCRFVTLLHEHLSTSSEADTTEIMPIMYRLENVVNMYISIVINNFRIHPEHGEPYLHQLANNALPLSVWFIKFYNWEPGNMGHIVLVPDDLVFLFKQYPTNPVWREILETDSIQAYLHTEQERTLVYSFREELRNASRINTSAGDF